MAVLYHFYFTYIYELEPTNASIIVLVSISIAQHNTQHPQIRGGEISFAPTFSLQSADSKVEASRGKNMEGQSRSVHGGQGANLGNSAREKG